MEDLIEEQIDREMAEQKISVEAVTEVIMIDQSLPASRNESIQVVMETELVSRAEEVL